MEIRNNVQSPNFGMALRIKNPQKTAEALKKLPAEVLNEYKAAGELLNDTKFYHVVVSNDLKPQIVSEEGAYWGPSYPSAPLPVIRFGEYNEHLKVGSSFGVSRLRGGEAAEDGVVHHNVWGICGSITDGTNKYDVKSLAQVAKTLDVSAIEYEKQLAAQKALEEASKLKNIKTVDELVSRFAVEA